MLLQGFFQLILSYVIFLLGLSRKQQSCLHRSQSTRNKAPLSNKKSIVKETNKECVDQQQEKNKNNGDVGNKASDSKKVEKEEQNDQKAGRTTKNASLEVQNPQNQKDQNASSTELSKDMVTFVLRTKDNPNLMYHNPQFPSFQPKKCLSEQSELVQENGLNVYSESAKSTCFKLNANIYAQVNLSHYLLASEIQVKSDRRLHTRVLCIKQGISNWDDRHLFRFNQIFNLIVVESQKQAQQLVFNMKQLQRLPIRIICHQTVFIKVHNLFSTDCKVKSISILANKFQQAQKEKNEQLLSNMDHELELELKEYIKQKDLLSLSLKYSKFGILQCSFLEMTASMVKHIFTEQANSSPAQFNVFKLYNSEYYDIRRLSIKCCKIFQQVNQSLSKGMEINQQVLKNEKIKAKRDLLRLAEYLLSTQFYKQYINNQIKEQPKYVYSLEQSQKNVTVQIRIQQILNELKQYPINVFYESKQSKHNKQLVYSLQELQELRLIPETNPCHFWACIQFFLLSCSPQRLTAMKLIQQYFSTNDSPLQLSYTRLYISDLSIAIKQLYHLNDQKNFNDQCYLAVDTNQIQLKTLRFGSKVLELQQFLVCSLNKQKQIQKPGNILLIIRVNKHQPRQYQSDYGFIRMSRHEKSNSPYNENIIFNILNTFYVQSVDYDSTYNKYVIRLYYGITSEIEKMFFLDRFLLSQEQFVLAQVTFSNRKKLNQILSQGDALLEIQKVDESKTYFQQFLLNAKVQNQINSLKISYIHQGISNVLKAKKNYIKAVEQLGSAMYETQRVYGSKCWQLCFLIKKQAEIYQLQNQNQRTLSRYQALINIAKRERNLILRSMQLNKIQSISAEQSFVLQELQEFQITCTLQIGRVYMEKLRKQDLSQSSFKKALDTAKSELGQYHPITADAYLSLGKFYLKYQVYESSIFNCKKSLVIRLNLFGEFNILSAESYKYLGRAYEQNQEFDQAFTYYSRNLKILKQYLKEDHEDLIDGYIDIANSLKKKGSYDPALQYYTQAMNFQIFKNGESTKRLNKLYHLIGQCYKRKGEYFKAAEYFQKYKQLSLAILQPYEFVQINQPYIQLGQIYEMQGKYEKAIHLYESPLLNVIRNKGKDHEDLIEHYQRLAAVHLKMSCDENWVQTQNDKKELQKKAFQFLKQILNICQVVGKNSMKTAIAYDYIGKIHLIKKDGETALSYFQQSLQIKKRVLKDDSNHASIASSEFQLGSALLLRESYSDSISHLQTAQKMTIQKYGENHSQMIKIYKKLAQCYLQKNEFSQSEKYCKKTLAIVLSLYGSFSMEAAHIHYQISILEHKKKEYSNALQAIVKAIETLKRLSLFEHTFFSEFLNQFYQTVQQIIQCKKLSQLRQAHYYIHNLFPENAQKLKELKEIIEELQTQESKSYFQKQSYKKDKQ